MSVVLKDAIFSHCFLTKVKSEQTVIAVAAKSCLDRGDTVNVQSGYMEFYLTA